MQKSPDLCLLAAGPPALPARPPLTFDGHLAESPAAARHRLKRSFFASLRFYELGYCGRYWSYPEFRSADVAAAWLTGGATIRSDAVYHPVKCGGFAAVWY